MHINIKYFFLRTGGYTFFYYLKKLYLTIGKVKN
jgi:hypothetical protein